jgi:hypothetical protein
MKIDRGPWFGWIHALGRKQASNGVMIQSLAQKRIVAGGVHMMASDANFKKLSFRKSLVPEANGHGFTKTHYSDFSVLWVLEDANVVAGQEIRFLKDLAHAHQEAVIP